MKLARGLMISALFFSILCACAHAPEATRTPDQCRRDCLGERLRCQDRCYFLIYDQLGERGHCLAACHDTENTCDKICAANEPSPTD